MPGFRAGGGGGALNDRSVGIEIVNPGHEWGYRAFPAAQMDAVAALCLGVLARHPIPARNVVGHSDVAPDRKQDPGELFDWRGLAAMGIGVWPERDAACGDVRGALTAIGYGFGELTVILRAFQLHWRPEGVTGVVDAETLGRLGGVAALV